MSKLHTYRAWLPLASLLLVCGTVAAQTPEAGPDHVMMTADDYAWSDAPASLPAGARVMVIEGNPAAEGKFTMRLCTPAGYAIQPHFHPADEHVTVISGALYMGLGEIFDEERAKRLPPGGFAMMSTGTTHYAFTREETVIQLHGVGPWSLTYADPEDDPRKQASTSR